MKINRLALLQYNIDLEMLALINAEENLANRILNKHYFDELKFQSGILGEFVKKPKMLKVGANAIINNSFKGATWSDRIWNRQDILRNIVSKSVEDLIVRGRKPTTMIGKLRREFNVSRNEAKRLLVTEGARVQTETQRLLYKENGFDKYIFVAEPSACPKCAALSDKVFNLEDMQIGTNAPPMHPHCHCATASYFKKEEDKNN